PPLVQSAQARPGVLSPHEDVSEASFGRHPVLSGSHLTSRRFAFDAVPFLSAEPPERHTGAAPTQHTPDPSPPRSRSEPPPALAAAQDGAAAKDIDSIDPRQRRHQSRTDAAGSVKDGPRDHGRLQGMRVK